jgi:acyl-CoA hydrolase
MAQYFDDVGECVESTLRRLGKRIVLALPLALGKPVPVANEFYRRATRDPTINLEILTALSLRKPTAASDLERRFLEPFVARVFGTYPELDYVEAVRAGRLPQNIQVTEFFLEPGAYLGSPYAQQHYLSANYTQVAREVLARGVNVVAQLVARRTVDGRPEFSLSCNPDLTADLLPQFERERRRGRDILLIGELNRQLPFMFGAAELPESAFEYLVEHPRYEFDLYSPPNLALGTVDYLIGLYASATVRDGGTLQLGIGELGDAIVYCLQLRHQQNSAWHRVLEDARADARFGADIDALGGRGVFEQGLYGCSEMFVDGFLDLYRSGILKRRVYPHVLLQRLLNEGHIGERVTWATLEALLEAGLSAQLSQSDFSALQRCGVFHSACRFERGRIHTPSGRSVAADLSTKETRDALVSAGLGAHLTDGALLHGAFFLGPKGFYAALRDLPEPERRQFLMSGVSFINQLYGEDQELRIEQRRHARFINTTMMMTALGAAVSDTLADGKVVSGVGGQYNFVAMAHALPGAHSILCLRSTRTKAGHTSSSIRFEYGACTVPRHLRDVVITEYGVAQLRGKSDSETSAALLNITDSRFQEDLLREAQAAGKISPDYRIPEVHRHNFPAALEDALLAHRRAGLFTEFPFGTDFTAEEIVLARVLKRLRDHTGTLLGKFGAVAGALVGGTDSAELRPYLQRMQLDRPRSAQEWMMRRLLAAELRRALD